VASALAFAACDGEPVRESERAEDEEEEDGRDGEEGRASRKGSARVGYATLVEAMRTFSRACVPREAQESRGQRRRDEEERRR